MLSPRGPSRLDLALFTRQLATLIQSGLPIHQSIDALVMLLPQALGRAGPREVRRSGRLDQTSVHRLLDGLAAAGFWTLEESNLPFHPDYHLTLSVRVEGREHSIRSWYGGASSDQDAPVLDRFGDYFETTIMAREWNTLLAQLHLMCDDRTR